MKMYDLICVVPVYNEEKIVPRAIPMLLRFLQDAQAKGSIKVVIADNGSTDGTARASRRLLKKYPKILAYEYIDKKGRGNALKSVLSLYKAKIYLYIDVDLPCEPQDIQRLIEGIEAGNDLVISRRIGGRPLLRRIMTFGLRYINYFVFRMMFSDVQCSVKALSAQAAALLKESCEQDGWYLDTELVVLSHQSNFVILETPITWVETRFSDRQSKVHPLRDIVQGTHALVAIKRNALRMKRHNLMLVSEDKTT